MAATAPDRYRVLREISRGGMAEIFLADDLVDRRRVALKVLTSQLAQDHESRQRFRHEAQSHQELHHENVVEVYDWGEHGERMYMALELVEGWSLGDLLLRVNKIPPEVALYVLQQILRGLAYAHDHGLVHRDVKPANVLLSRTGMVKLADFGIAYAANVTRLTQAGTVVGTPDYMAPEQALGDLPDHRSDLFSAGVMLYEMLSGVCPYHTDNPTATLRRIIEADHAPLFDVLPGVSPELEMLAENLMASEIGARYQSAAQALDDLETSRLSLFHPLADRDALARFLHQPDVETGTRARAIAAVHLERAVSGYDDGRGNAPWAAWQLHLSTTIDPTLEEARDRLQRILLDRALKLVAADDAKIAGARSLAEKNPGAPAFLANLARAYVEHGVVVDAMSCFVRLLRQDIREAYVLDLIKQFFGDENFASIDRVHCLVPRRTKPRRRAAPSSTTVAKATPVDLPTARRELRREPATPRSAAVVAPEEVLLLGLAALLLVVALYVDGLPRLGTVLFAGFMMGFALRPVLMLRWSPSEVYEKGLAQLELGAHARAEATFRRFRFWFPEDRRAGDAALALGKALLAQGRGMEALEILYLGLEHMELPAQIEARKIRVRVMLSQGRRDAAADEYRALVATNDAREAPEAALALARLLNSEERFQEALEEVEGTIEGHPRAANRLEALLFKAELLAIMGRNLEALETVKEIQTRVGKGAKAYRDAADLAARIVGKGIVT